MKKFALTGLCMLTAGCVGFHDATPPGDNSPRRVSSISEFAGVYANRGVDASSRPQQPLREFLFRYSDSRFESADQVALRFPDAKTMEVEVRSGISVVETKKM